VAITIELLTIRIALVDDVFVRRKFVAKAETSSNY